MTTVVRSGEPTGMLVVEPLSSLTQYSPPRLCIRSADGEVVGGLVGWDQFIRQSWIAAVLSLPRRGTGTFVIEVELSSDLAVRLQRELHRLSEIFEIPDAEARVKALGRIPVHEMFTASSSGGPSGVRRWGLPSDSIAVVPLRDRASRWLRKNLQHILGPGREGLTFEFPSQYPELGGLTDDEWLNGNLLGLLLWAMHEVDLTLSYSFEQSEQGPYLEEAFGSFHDGKVYAVRSRSGGYHCGDAILLEGEPASQLHLQLDTGLCGKLVDQVAKVADRHGVPFRCTTDLRSAST